MMTTNAANDVGPVSSAQPGRSLDGPEKHVRDGDVVPAMRGEFVTGLSKVKGAIMTVNWSWLIQGHPVKPRWPWSYRPSVKRQKEYATRTIERIGKDAWNEKRRAIRHKNPDSHRAAVRRARSNFIDAHGIEAYRARAKKHREDFKARYIAEHGLEGWKEYKRRTDSRRNKNAG